MGGVMDWTNEKRPRHLCVRVRTAARARAMRGGALRVLRVLLRVLRVVRARQLPSRRNRRLYLFSCWLCFLLVISR